MPYPLYVKRGQFFVTDLIVFFLSTYNNDKFQDAFNK